MRSDPLNILIAEDSKFFSAAIQHKLKEIDDINIYLATSYKEAKQLIAEHKANFFLALLDINLPDAPDGEIIELTDKSEIPSIIFSSNFDKDTREKFYNSGVIDCVPKDSPSSLEYFVSLVRRILLNRSLTVMVVDDSKVMRSITSSQLKKFQLKVICAKNGREALDKLSIGVPVHLILTDYEMPEVDGFEFIRELRRDYSKDRLPVIGMSAVGNSEIAINFLKSGANDFIHKPFTYEELLCRTFQNLDLYNLFEDLKKAVYKDALTGLNNRRYLFEHGEGLFSPEGALEDDIIVAMADVDHFKNFNDTYGHSVGDDVLVKVAQEFEKTVGEKATLARFGGEEFCVVMTGMNEAAGLALMEKARLSVAAASVDVEGQSLSVAVSIGLCTSSQASFDEMVNEADKALYVAKESGRNCVKIAEETAADIKEFPQRSVRGSARSNKENRK